MGKSTTRIFKKSAIFLSLLSVIHPTFSQADDIYWNNFANNHQFFDSSNWSTGTFPNLLNDLHIDNTNGQLVEFKIDPSITYPNGDASYINGDDSHTLFIGSSAGNSAGVKITSSIESWPLSLYAYGSITVGSSGGQGVLEYHDYVSIPADYSGPISVDGQHKASLDFSNLNIGSGLNSDGLVSLTGTGKTSAQYMINSSAFVVKQLHTGVDGGKGALIVDGSSIDIATMGYTDAPRSFSLGSGTDSGVAGNGSINVLGGGKMMVSANAYNDGLNSAVIGENQGHGKLTISGSFIRDGELIQSQAIFNQGLEIGVNAGSIGSVLVIDGGKLSTASARNDTSNIGGYVGVDKGTGSVVVSGIGSIWHVNGHTNIMSQTNEVGHLSIGESGTGNLTVANGGVVSMGSTGYVYQQSGGYGYYAPIFDNTVLGNLYLATQSNGVGTLNIGGTEGDAPQAVGSVEAEHLVRVMAILSSITRI